MNFRAVVKRRKPISELLDRRNEVIDEDRRQVLEDRHECRTDLHAGRGELCLDDLHLVVEIAQGQHRLFADDCADTSSLLAVAPQLIRAGLDQRVELSSRPPEYLHRIRIALRLVVHLPQGIDRVIPDSVRIT